MAKVPKISDAEWEVMNVLWERAPQSANDIVDALEDRKWSPATIRTMIGRLVQKNALTFEKAGREHWYRPRVARDACVRQERRSFIQRVYGGAVQPLMAGLLEDEDLSDAELDALDRLLKEKRRGSK